jgi:hypothetical protein
MEADMASLTGLVDTLRAHGRIAPEDVLALRRTVFEAVEVSPDEAEALIVLNEAVADADACPEWRAFYVEAMTDYVVRQQLPAGYVDDAKADWLVRRLARDGWLKTGSELELLVHVLEAADSAPAKLSVFVIDQVRRAALGDDGALDRSEVELIRRTIFALGGQGGVDVTVMEADALFDLNDAVRGRANDPAWTDLFARAVGAAILAASGYQAPSRDEVLRREAWLEAPTEGLGSFFRRMAGVLGSGGRGVSDSFDGDETVEQIERDNAEWAGQRADALRVTEREAGWLIARIGRDGMLDDNERALLAFLKAEQPDVPAALRPLYEQAA